MYSQAVKRENVKERKTPPPVAAIDMSLRSVEPPMNRGIHG
jgi:hypothetical protein